MIKRARFVAGAVAALAAALCSTSPGAASPVAATATPEARAGVVLVKGGDAAVARARAALHATAGTRLEGVPGWHEISLPSRASVAAAARAARSIPGITRAEPDYVARIADAWPDDPCVTQACPTVPQWNLFQTGFPLAWQAYPGKVPDAAHLSDDPTRPLVAVIDTTIDDGHPDWVPRGGQTADASGGGQLDVADSRTWVAQSKTTGSAAYHGTFVAGIIAAAAGNGIDLAGAAYDAVVLPLAAVDGSGQADAASLAEAIAEAHARGARVINMSLGMQADSQAVHDAIVAATSGPNASLVVAAAGNNTKDAPFYPGSYPEVMSVSGVDSSRNPAPCSNYNDNVSVAAPARDVMSLAPMPERHRMIDCGTSAAAPHVSAIAALLFGQDPARTASEVRSIIERTADDAGPPGRDAHFGYGIADADRALHDGAGPGIASLSATIAKRGDGTSTITAVATSRSPISAAEAYVDQPGNPDARIALSPADGDWGGTTEKLTGVVTISPNEPDEAHDLYVRAKDASWGAASRAVLAVDRTPPQISNVRASNAILGQKATVSFTISDALSTRFSYSVTINAPDGSVAYSSPATAAALGPQDLYWTPDWAAMPGIYRVTIFVWDEAGNPAAAAASPLVV